MPRIKPLLKISSQWILGCGMFTFWMMSPGCTQTLVQDSLILEVRLPVVHDGSNSNIINVFDHRNISDPKLLGISEIRHYGVVPVDLHIITASPITDLIRASLPPVHMDRLTEMSLALTHLNLSVQSIFPFYKRYRVNACIQLLKHNNHDSLSPAGMLVFDSGITRCSFRNQYPRETTLSVERWISDLVRDVQSVSSGTLPANFQTTPHALLWMQLRMDCDFFLIPEGYILDGQLHFIYPESHMWFFDSARIMRYRHQTRFDALEYSLMNTSLNFRMNSDFMLQFQSSLLFGINRWKDMNSVEHGLEDIFIGDISLSQKLSFIPKNTKSLILGVGFWQSLYYISSLGFNLQPGLNFHIGLKL